MEIFDSSDSYDPSITVKGFLGNILKLNLKELDDFLIYITSEINLNIEKVVDSVQRLITQEEIFNVQFDIGKIDDDYKIIGKNSDLIDKIGSLLLIRMGYKKENNYSIHEEKDVSVLDWLNGYLYMRFLELKILYRLFEKNEALEIIKKYIDYRTKNHSKISRVKNLKELIKHSGGIFQGAFNSKKYIIDKGKVGVKITKCKWIEVAKEFADSEEMYALYCHYDFEAAKAMNKNFVLTRTTTLAAHECCDFCWHDKTKSDCKHPDSLFWDKL